MSWRTVEETAEILGVTKATVYNWISAGKFPGALHRVCRGRNKLWVPDEDIDPVLDELEESRVATEGLLSSKQASWLLRLNPDTLNDYAGKGTIPSVRDLWGRLYFKREDVEAFAKAREKAEQAPGSCLRCSILITPRRDRLCWLCRYELAHEGRPYINREPLSRTTYGRTCHGARGYA